VGVPIVDVVLVDVTTADKVVGLVARFILLIGMPPKYNTQSKYAGLVAEASLYHMCSAVGESCRVLAVGDDCVLLRRGLQQTGGLVVGPLRINRKRRTEAYVDVAGFPVNVRRHVMLEHCLVGLGTCLRARLLSHGGAVATHTSRCSSMAKRRETALSRAISWRWS